MVPSFRVRGPEFRRPVRHDALDKSLSIGLSLSRQCDERKESYREALLWGVMLGPLICRLEEAYDGRMAAIEMVMVVFQARGMMMDISDRNGVE
ncbi:hypothetical protein EVAR_50948_1 [Eumeta japonica]|uniref:Uncharacterized protein n=1 Tax=Eumeta variegata TaxID=151549 RepID=A0A4C1XDT4_EUMVA|nr:hypothetical protein EVAR_50948_1 [Eumeta japonica]